MPAYFSHADNFLNTVSSNVDPRTGLYSCTINLGQNSQNNFRGPKLPLLLGYTPYLGDDYGFGVGWILNFSTFEDVNKIVSCSSGESYAVDDRGVPSKVKIAGFNFLPSDDSCRIEHTDGSVEILDGQGSAYGVKYPRTILSPTGAAYTLAWIPQASHGDRKAISSITTDDGVCMLDVNYDDPILIVITLWRDSDMEVVYNLSLEQYLLQSISAVTGDAKYKWLFSYDWDNTCIGGNGPLLTQVTYPSGMVETVAYDAQGHRFPNGAPETYLPSVKTFTRSPHGDQPVEYCEYVFDDAITAQRGNNFLGGTTTISGYQSNDENLYDCGDLDYTYGSIVYQKSTGDDASDDNTLIKTTRIYNVFHLLTEETSLFTDLGTKVHNQQKRITTYNMLPSKAFDDQPNNFQLPSRVETTFSSQTFGGAGRVEVHEFDYDAVDGVRTRVRTPDGVETRYTYYDASSTEANGCPPPPTLADRKRYPQTIAITYPQVAAAGGGALDAPREVHTLTYRAITLASDGANAPAAYAVVPLRVVSSVAGVNVRQVDIAWYESNADTGRIKTVTEKLAVVDSNGNTGALQLAAQLQVSYPSSQDAFTEALVLTGYDGDGKPQTAFASRTFCPRTGALTAMTDQLGVTQTRAHDWLGRIVALTTASGSTDYQHILKCDYTLADDGSGTGVSLLQGKIYDDTQTTPAAMQRAANVHFDGAHRATAVDIDADNTSNFVRSATALHDALARPTVYNTFDQTISTTRTNGYDAWTLNNVQGASTGATGRSDFDPVARVNATTWTATQPSNMAAGLITTYDDLNTPATIGRRDSSGKTIATTTMVHDGRKRQRSHTSEAGNTTTTGHDAWNRPITATLPDKTVIDVAHAFNTTHPLPQAICITPAGGQKATVATRTHDGLLRPITETWDARTTSWTYNTGATKPATRTLQDKLKQHAATTTCTYVSELKEALASRSAGSITQTFAYDRRGSLTSATQVDAADPRNNATVTRSHDRWGRISTENVKLGGQDLGTATWTYTRLGKPIKWTHASADANIGVDAIYDFTWYANGLLSAAKRKVGKAPDYTIAYTYFDNTSETAPVASANGVHAGMLQGWTVTTNGAALAKARLTYDDFNREASRTISFYPMGNAATPCSTIVINRTYGPDNRLAKSVVTQDGAMIQTMDLGSDQSYDARQRLAHVTYAGTYRPQLDNGAPIDSIAYAQDALNNITSVTRAAGATQDADAFAYNSDTSFQISNITRTLAGAPTTLAVSHDPATGAITQLGDDAYTYDALGRLTHASRQGADAKAATYRYDALDRLICETPDSGQARYFVYAGDTLAAFIDASIDGAPSGQVTQLMQAAGGTVLEIQGNAGANLLATDVSGTVIAFADRDDIAEGLPEGPSFIAWDPYGAAPETRPENPPATGYNGHYADQTFQIQHLGNGHRPYAPQIARFLAPDTESPFGNGGLNPYAYCENDPVNFNDPTGKMKWWKIFTCIAYAGVAIAGIGIAIAAMPVFGVATIVLGGAMVAWGVTGIIDEATGPQAVSYATANSGGGSNSADHTYKTSHSIHKWSFIIGALVGGFSGGSAKKTASPSPESLAAKSSGRFGSAPDIIGGSGGTRALPQPEKASNEALLNPKSHPENAAPGWGPPDVAMHASSPAHPYDDVFPAGNPANERLWVTPANADASSGFGHMRPHFGKPAGTRR